MKIALSGEEKAIVALYLGSFIEHYKSVKNKRAAKLFNNVRYKFLLNSDKVDIKRGDWSFIVRTLLEGKRLITTNLPDVDKIENEKERDDTKKSMEYALGNISSTVKKIQESI